MEFIDKTGHIFSITSYSQYPTGYEYEETPYIFWINETGKLSVDNYYIKAIRVVFDNRYKFDDNTHLNIKLDSKIYNLIGSVQINKLLNENTNIFEYFTLNKKNKNTDTYKDSLNNIFKQELTEDDILLLTNLTDENGYEYSMATFYIVAYSSNESVMLTNMLIDIYENETHDYCPVTIGSEFVDENEMLIINGKNMGISLPKDIIRAIYKSSFYSYTADEYLYNSKLKELLLNYMNIKGECGNYKSASDSLKWFEWGDNLKIAKLLETDNQFINQYIIDKFDIHNDVIESYKLFRNTTYIKLFLEGTKETDTINRQNFNVRRGEFFGEGKPIITDLVNSNTYVSYDEEDIRYYKPYYNFLFDELGLKLAALEYYYKQYFLPIHLFVHNTTIQFQCFTNDNKFMIGANKTIITEQPQITYDVNDNIEVIFPKNNYIMLTTQNHFVDENYNEFNKYILLRDEELNTDDSEIRYWVNENCMSIPIKFAQYEYISDNNGNNVKTEKTEQYYDCQFVLEKIEKATYNYLYSFLFNFDYDEFFTLNAADANSNVTNKILISIQQWETGYAEQKLVLTNKWSEYMSYSDIKQFIIDNYITPLPFNETKPYFNIKIKSITYLTQIKCGTFDYVKYSNCEVLDDFHEVIYEKNFKFVQKINKPETFYKNFVIVPKIFGKLYDVNFWLNNEFNLYVCVNGEWFTYNFNCRVPEFQIEIGKLYYKYFLDSTNSYVNQHGEVSLFNQLNSLTDDKVVFNRFIWQPNLVKVNNIDFFDNLLEYYKDYKYNITYNKNHNNLNIISSIEGNTNMQDIKLNDLYYVLTFNDQKFYIHHNVITTYFIKHNESYFQLNVNQLSENNKQLDWVAHYVDGGELDFTAVYNETNFSNDTEYKGSSGSLNTNEIENILITNEDGKNIMFTTLLENNVDVNILDSNDDENYVVIFEDENNSEKHFILVFFEIDTNGVIHFYVKDIYNNNIYLNIEKTIYKNIDILFDKYKDYPNIVNNRKYLSRVHLYDIYKNGKLLAYNSEEPLTEKEQAKLYNIFFNQDEHCTQCVQLPNAEDVYDFYLMHNDTQWYGLFISKLPENNYFKSDLEIVNDNEKVLTYYNDVNKIFIDVNEETGLNDYYNINTAILNNVCLKTGLVRDDMFIVFNDISISVEDESIAKNELETYLHYSLINKIYNKNIGSKQVSIADDNDIVWNDNNDFIVGQNWCKINPTDICCPYCGSNEHIKIVYNKKEQIINGIPTLVNTGKYQIECHNHTTVDDEGNEISEPIVIMNNIDYNNEAVLNWNDTEIPYKLIYTLNNDIYTEKNPNGNYHLATDFKYAQYTFSMNNIMYYIIGKKNEKTNKVEYFLNGDNEAVEIQTEYNGYIIEDLVYDNIRDTYVAKQILNETDNELHDYDFIKGLDKNKLHHYIDLDTIQIYTEALDNYQEACINNYYMLYDGKQLYNDEWYIVINSVPTEKNNNLTISDIIKIYKRSDDSELKWVVNPSYNYKAYNEEENTGMYIYYYDYVGDKTNGQDMFFELANDEDKIIGKQFYLKLYNKNTNKNVYVKIIYSNNWADEIEYYYIDNGQYVKYNKETLANNKLFIKYNDLYICTELLTSSTDLYKEILPTINFVNNIPNSPIYMDDKGYFFDLIFSNGRWQKRYIYRKINSYYSDLDTYTLYDVNTGIYYKKNHPNILLNTETWFNEHPNNGFILTDPFKNDGEYSENDKPKYDGLYYLYSTDTVIIDNDIVEVPHWQVLIYINDYLIADSFDWYYKINGKKYKYNGKVISYIEDVNGNKIQQQFTSTDYVTITLSDVGLSPIRVELNIINETQKTPPYYNLSDEYKFKYVKSDDKFLVNRMQYISCNGKNQFNTDDIIVTTISPKMDKVNSDGSVLEFKTEFKLNYSTKWVYEPMSLKMKNSASVVANAEMAMMSIGDSNIKYEKGYYNLKCNYSLDGNTENIYTKTARILVK